MPYSVRVFSYRLDGEPSHQPVVDCRVVRQPHRRGQSDEASRALARQHPAFAGLVGRGVALALRHGVVYVGCSWGRHRSVAVAQDVAAALEQAGHPVRLYLRPRG